MLRSLGAWAFLVGLYLLILFVLFVCAYVWWVLMEVPPHLPTKGMASMGLLRSQLGVDRTISVAFSVCRCSPVGVALLLPQSACVIGAAVSLRDEHSEVSPAGSSLLRFGPLRGNRELSSQNQRFRADPAGFFSEASDSRGSTLEALVSDRIMTKKRSVQGVICSLQSGDYRFRGKTLWKLQMPTYNGRNTLEASNQPTVVRQVNGQLGLFEVWGGVSREVHNG